MKAWRRILVFLLILLLLFAASQFRQKLYRSKPLAEGAILLSTGGKEVANWKATTERKWLMKLRAFVFEDNDALRSLISSILESRGYRVFSYSEPLHCPVYLDRECPCPEDYACGDIFVTDNNMPNITGLEFIENQTRNGCKAITKNKAVISAAWKNTELQRAKELGCKTFEKPFRANELLSWLAQCEKRIDPNRKLSDLPLRFEHG